MSTGAPVPTDVSLGKRPRSQQTVGDMLRTLLVVGGFVLFLVVMVWRPWHHTAIKSVDWRAAATVAAGAKIVPVVGPTALPKDWVATSARLDVVNGGRAWHIGFVTPTNKYAAVGVTNISAIDYINTVMPEPSFTGVTAGAVKSGTAVIDGVTWTTYDVPRTDNHALVRTDKNGITYAVYGTAGYRELTLLLRALAPIQPTP